MRHRRSTVLFLLAALSGLAGCGSEGAERQVTPSDTTRITTSQSAAPTTDSAAFVSVDLPVLLNRVDDRRRDGTLRVLDELNPPLRVEREPVQNRHDPGQTDTILTLLYSGMRIEVYKSTDSGKEIVRSLTISGDAYQTEQGLTIGSTRAEVRKVLGEPAGTEDETLVYELTRGENDPTPTFLHVRFDGDHVAAMSWDFYVD